MNNTYFPIISEFDLKLPFYLASVGCCYIQEHIERPEGYPYLQWIQCRKGRGELILNGQNYIIEENQGMLLYPNIPHEYYGISDPWEVDWISMGGFALEPFFAGAGMDKSQAFTVSQPGILLNHTKKILQIVNLSSDMKSHESSKALYTLLLDITAYTYKNRDVHRVHQYSKLKPVIDYINENYNKIITIEDLGTVAGVTPEYLCTIFKKITGVRVFEYINNIRINNSKVLMLKHRNMQLKEIARSCGFEDMSYFCSVFKRIEKLTPGEFRTIH